MNYNFQEESEDLVLKRGEQSVRVMDSLLNGGSQGGGGMVEITYSELKALRDNSQLKPGQWYRIIDYTTTTVQTNTQSAGHQFDILVLADAPNKLNENAHAALHSGDTYFSTAGAKLEAWELKYRIDNDTNRFAWADSTNGKGVIWWMKDENGNECPYDFKNIMFKFTSAISQSGIVANVFYYTFSVATGTDDATVTDNSLDGNNCYRNKIGECIRYYSGLYKQELNSNVFRNNTSYKKCTDNTFESDCYKNTFGANCSSNTFGYECSENEFNDYCNGNTFEGGCTENTFGNSCKGNTFGKNCFSNTFGSSCSSNAFGSSCTSNIFGSSCQGNTFGKSCFSNTFGNYCEYNVFGSWCYNITFGTSSSPKSYCQYIIVETGNCYIYLDCSATTSQVTCFQNVKIALGTNNQESYKTITHTTVNDRFQTIYQSPATQIISFGDVPTSGDAEVGDIENP